MLTLLLEPFHYQYIVRAILASAAVGATCAFLSTYLILKGWSLIGDALSHSVVPGVATAYAIKLPYAFGAFFTGMLAALGIVFVRQITKLREDAIIGFIFSTFFAVGLLIISLNPTSVSVNTIIFGNILSIDNADLIQVSIIAAISFLVLFILRKDLLMLFFDPIHANSAGLSSIKLTVIFFTLLSACTVAALQTVGAILVVAMLITPGATAYLLTKRFHRMMLLSILIGLVTCAVGTYFSYFINAATSGIIATLQTLLFLLTFIFSPKQGLIISKIRRYGRMNKISSISK